MVDGGGFDVEAFDHCPALVAFIVDGGDRGVWIKLADVEQICRFVAAGQFDIVEFVGAVGVDGDDGFAGIKFTEEETPFFGIEAATDFVHPNFQGADGGMAFFFEYHFFYGVPGNDIAACPTAFYFKVAKAVIENFETGFGGRA